MFLKEHARMAAATPAVPILTTRAPSPVATTTNVTVDQCTTARVDLTSRTTRDSAAAVRVQSICIHKQY